MKLKPLTTAAISSFLLSASAGTTSAAPEAAKKAEFNICYFSLNKSDEYDLTKSFMNKLNANSAVKINVIEFQPDKDTIANKKEAIPNTAFRKMVESGTKCEGLVISGHHTGSYGGKRAYDKQRLEMDVMEALSCDPKHADFFRNINAVWLEGCRTLGVGTIVAGQEGDERFNPDHHTNRVGGVLDDDQLGQNYAQLNNEFTNTLDQDNPLSSRYLRLFPSAKLFGWTQTAPGEKANSQYSMLFHIAHMSRILDAQNDFPKESPLSPTITADSAARYMDGVLLALARFGKEEQKCEELSTTAWIAHGTKGKLNDRYAFDNPDLTAFTPLSSSGNEAVQTMKGLDCQLKAAGRSADMGKLNAVLDVLNARPELLPYAFNSLVDLRNQALKQAAVDKSEDGRKKKSQFAQAILDRMKTHPTVKTFLETKIASKQLGVMRKIDYYKFYNSMTGKTVPAVQTEIEARILDELKKPLPRTSQTSRMLARSYRRMMLESGLKNKLLSPGIAESILALNPEYDVLEAMAKLINFIPSDDKVALLARLASFPQANKIVAGEVLTAIHNILGDTSRYQSYYNSLWVPLKNVDDYWHGEIHEDNGTVTPATPLTAIPPAGSIGGPPGVLGAAPVPVPRKPGQPAPPPAPVETNPVEDFFRNIFGR
ncbi:MAG: hypothetical protein AB7K68_01700 [Bacteriovoracia bacterium]